MKRNTVGKIASELLNKPKEKISVIDQQRAMQEDYWKNLTECVDRGFKKYSKSFFVEVIVKKEPLMENVYRNYFIDRKTCPTPNYDQTVFRYNNDTQHIELVWVIPDRGTAFHLKENALLVAPEEKELLQNILDFSDGTLFKLCKELNNEKINSTLLEKGA